MLLGQTNSYQNCFNSEQIPEKCFQQSFIKFFLFNETFANAINFVGMTYYKNPEIDILFGYVGIAIPSKREDFKPVNLVLRSDNEIRDVLSNLYIKKPSSQSVGEFEKLVRDIILGTPSLTDKKIMKPTLVEITIAVSVNKKRFLEVDVDNIAKTVMDSIKGYLIEDDSQVKRLICEKDIHPLNENGFLVGLVELTSERKGILANLFLYSQHSND